MGVRNGHCQGPQTMLLALQTEPKWVKIEGSERSSSKAAPGRFRRPSGTPKHKKKKPCLGAVLGPKRDPKTRCALRGLLGSIRLQMASETESKWLQNRVQKGPMPNMENCAPVQTGAHFWPLRRGPKRAMFWSLSSDPSGDPSWETL